MSGFREILLNWRCWRAYRATVLPAVAAELEGWRRRAAAIPDPRLRREALRSIDHKAFHCQGGAVLALLAPARVRSLVRLIVALQTLSDVLDSWTDRAGVRTAAGIRRLHRAMVDAVCPGQTPARYGLEEGRADGGYLAALVACCRRELARLPGYGRVQGPVRRLVERYVDLQVLKHQVDGARGPALVGWHRQRREEAAGLSWWEYAAAAGSTLAVFALVGLAARSAPPPGLLRATLEAYVPWICALHILLDYLIDRDEDLAGGDLNLVEPYGEPAVALARLVRLARTAAGRVDRIPLARDRALHRLVLQGLPALYLSDPKAAGLRRAHPAGVARLEAATGPGGPALALLVRWRRRGEPLQVQPPGDPGWA